MWQIEVECQQILLTGHNFLFYLMKKIQWFIIWPPHYFNILSVLRRNTVFFVTYKQWETNTPNGATMLWDDIRYDPGNNYDNVTGTYTAPYDGYYQFSITKRSRGKYAQLLTYVDGVSAHRCWNHDDDGYSSQTSCTIVIKLLAGQRVHIRNIQSTVTQSLEESKDWTAVNSWFTGHMLFPL